MSSVVPSEQREAERVSLGRLVEYAGAVAALGLASLYVVGAISRTSELRGAGFSTTIALDATPVQQLLASGISALASPGTVLTVVLLALQVAGFLYLDNWTTRRQSEPVPVDETGSFVFPPTRRERFGALSLPKKAALVVLCTSVGVVALLIVIFVCLQAFYALNLTLIPYLLAYVAGWLATRRTRLRFASRVAITVIVATLLGSAAYALIRPAPLPEVRVELLRGSTVGILLSTSDAETTVGLGDCRIASFPAAQIREVVVFPRQGSPTPNVGTELFGYPRQPKPPIPIPGRCGVRSPPNKRTTG